MVKNGMFLKTSKVLGKKKPSAGRMVCGYNCLKLSPHKELLVVCVLVDVLIKDTINKNNNPVN